MTQSSDGVVIDAQLWSISKVDSVAVESEIWVDHSQELYHGYGV